MITDEIKTERLILRQLTAGDLPYIYRQFSDSEMCTYFSESPYSMREAEELIRQFQYKDNANHFRVGDEQQDQCCYTLLENEWRKYNGNN